jgi:uncharacterized protein YjbI with pentapeptide repeats
MNYYSSNPKKIRKITEELLKSSDANTREDAASQLSKIYDKNTTKLLLEQFNVESDVDVIKMIIYALGKIASTEAIDALKKLSQNDDFEIRWVTLEALGNFNDARASEILIDSLKTEKDEHIRIVIVKSLGKFKSESVIKCLMLFLDEESDSYLKQEACISLNKLGCTNDWDLILEKKQNSIKENKASIIKEWKIDILDHNEEDNKISLFKGWNIEYFDITCSSRKQSSATVLLVNELNTGSNNCYSESVCGVGATSTLFFALDKAISHIIDESQHIVESVKVSNLEESVESSVMASVVVKSNGRRIKKFCIHNNIVKACFFAYTQAIKAIYGHDDKFNSIELEKTLYPMSQLIDVDVLKQYERGERDFSKLNLREANLVGLDLSEIDLSLSDLSFSNLQGIQLHNARLDESILKKGIISEANLSQSVMCRAKLEQAVLRNTSLVQVDLTGANLTNANLFNADLTGANLTNANLSNADLTGANLTNANLSNADLTEVDLTNTIIDGANFSNANLSKVDLRNLDLNTVLFCNTVLTDTKMPEVTIKIYGAKRIERVIQLFNQFQSDRYEICAIDSNTLGCWWNSDIGLKFRQANKALRNKNISIKRVFIVPEIISESIKKIIREQLDDGIEVLCLSEEIAKSMKDYNSIRNLLVCKNLSVPENSFTTMMSVNQLEEEESGCISYRKDKIVSNAAFFEMIWYKAKPVKESQCLELK